MDHVSDHDDGEEFNENVGSHTCRKKALVRLVTTANDIPILPPKPQDGIEVLDTQQELICVFLTMHYHMYLS